MRSRVSPVRRSTGLRGRARCYGPRMRALLPLVWFLFLAAAVAGCQCGGQPCRNGTECASGVCVDGACGQGKSSGASCAAATECTAGACTNGRCEAGNGPGASCAAGAQCGSGSCLESVCQAGATPTGGACAQGGQCASGVCKAGACQPGSGVDGAPCTSAAQCASATCGSGKCGGRTACKKVDLVISVDNSSSMKEEKQAMSNTVFPAFAQALRKVGGGLESFRVGVTDACPLPANFHTRGVANVCNFQGGKTWMESSSTALEDEFRCVGDIDSRDSTCTGSNDDEQPASTAAKALEPPMSTTGPNAGFSRDDAVLVVMAITDEDEQPTPAQPPQQVFQRLIAVKGGSAKRMVFLGIGGAKSCSGVYGSAKEAVQLKALTDLFIAQGRGVFTDLCAGKLEDGLTQAVQVVQTACEQLVETGGAGAPCSANTQCASMKCTNSLCEGGPGGKPAGSACTTGSECASSLCIEGVCSPGLG